MLLFSSVLWFRRVCADKSGSLSMTVWISEMNVLEDQLNGCDTDMVGCGCPCRG